MPEMGLIKMNEIKTDKSILDLIESSVNQFNSLSKEEQDKMFQMQKESYVRGEMSIGSDVDEANFRRSLKK